MKKHSFNILYDLVMMIMIILVILKFCGVSAANWYITLLPLFLIIFMKLFIVVKELIRDFDRNIGIFTGNLWIIQAIVLLLKLFKVSLMSWFATLIPILLILIIKGVIFAKEYGHEQ